MKALKAAVISNGIEGLKKYFVSNELAEYEIIEVEKNFNPDLSSYDLLIVPNGSDHIAMLKIKSQVLEFLNQGKTLFCFDGWFTNWIPGNQWIMNNELKTIDVRYTINQDKSQLFENVDIEQLNFNHKISGWWSCGYIKTNSKSSVLLQDTWSRAIVVLDEKSTNGTIFLTASGPLGDSGAIPSNDQENIHALSQLYYNALNYIKNKQATLA
jgi:hypothetical protein